jgi:hypothetical protein
MHGKMSVKNTYTHFYYLEDIWISSIFFIILDWGPVPHFCPLKALQPVWLMPEVSCTISKRSYSGRQVPLASTIRGSPLAARGGTYGREIAAS